MNRSDRATSARVRVPAAAAVAGAALAAVSPAAGITFGANLDTSVPNAPLVCAQGWPGAPSIFGVFFLQQGAASCTWTNGDLSGSGQGMFVPATGTITRVRVRVGPQTGPMQVVIMRSLFRQTGDVARPQFACCSAVAFGPRFTPAPNAVTTLDVSLPVTAEPAPPPTDTTTVAAADLLALSVLDGTTPIPLFDTGAHNGIGAPSAIVDNVWYPAPNGSTQEVLPAGDPSGYVVTMNADLTPGAGGGGAGGGGGGGGGTTPVAPGGGGGVTPQVTLPASARLRNDVAPLLIACRGDARCVGRVLLQSTRPAGAAERARARAVTFGSAGFTIAAGARGTVRVRLNRAGRALVSSRRRVAVWEVVTFTGSTARQVRRLMLTR